MKFGFFCKKNPGKEKNKQGKSFSLKTCCLLPMWWRMQSKFVPEKIREVSPSPTINREESTSFSDIEMTLR